MRGSSVGSERVQREVERSEEDEGGCWKIAGEQTRQRKIASGRPSPNEFEQGQRR